METETATIETPIECQINWQKMSEDAQIRCIAAHVEGYKKAGVFTQMMHMKRLFDLGNPEIIMSTDQKGIWYCRVAPESVDVMKVILNNYL